VYYVFGGLVKNGTGNVELWHSACKLASSDVKFVAAERPHVTCSFQWLIQPRLHVITIPVV